MNQNLPKPMIDALGRDAAPAEHPSADLLTAFAENTLQGDENRRITDHLARCAQCRDIIFLAGSAAEEQFEEQHELVAAAAAPIRVSQAAAQFAKRPRWTARLAWSAAIAVGLAFVAGVFLWRRTAFTPTPPQLASRATNNTSPTPMQSVRVAPPPPPSTAETIARTQAAKPQTKGARASNASPTVHDTLGLGATTGTVASENSAPAKSGTVTAGAVPSTIAIGERAVASAPAAPHANSFATAQGGPVGAARGTADMLLVNPQTTVRSVSTTHWWRITADGHLEHSTAEGWTRVLADQTATFRVVSVVGNHVWAGGSGGMLFHSRDFGHHWEEVPLTTPAGRETATLVAIEFDDSQHGTVTTNNGTRCTTTDGGGTWNCE
jgi:hypothetical protein